MNQIDPIDDLSNVGLLTDYFNVFDLDLFEFPQSYYSVVIFTHVNTSFLFRINQFLLSLLLLVTLDIHYLRYRIGFV